jgi:hypothetical protein
MAAVHYDLSFRYFFRHASIHNKAHTVQEFCDFYPRHLLPRPLSGQIHI